MAKGLADWIRGYVLQGLNPSGDLVTITVDDNGNLYALIKGEDGTGSLHTIAVDAAGQIIMIPRGESGNYLAIDSDGYMTTVIKGDYEGALRTVTLDDAGRISAFVYDSKDAWDQISTVGFAELAARLGSPVIYERSGQVNWIETFEHGLQRWFSQTSGTGAGVALSPVYAKTAGYSCELTGGSDGGRWASITSITGVNPVGKMGISMAFANITNFDALLIYFKLRTTGTQYSTTLEISKTLGKVYIYDEVPAAIEVCDCDLPSAMGQYWSTVKMTVDFENVLYGKLRFNAGEYDISANAFVSTSGSYTPEVSVEIRAKSRSGNNDVIHVDDIILSFAEP